MTVARSPSASHPIPFIGNDLQNKASVLLPLTSGKLGRVSSEVRYSRASWVMRLKTSLYSASGSVSGFMSDGVRTLFAESVWPRHCSASVLVEGVKPRTEEAARPKLENSTTSP